MTTHVRRPSPARRVAAALALLCGAITVVVAAVTLVQEPLAGLAMLAGLALAVALAWQGVLRAGLARHALFTLAALVIVAALAVLAAKRLLADLALIGAGAAVTSAMVRGAFAHRGSAGGAWERVPRCARPVLLVNPHSGGGKAERAGLVGAARARGVACVVTTPEDDLRALARRAIIAGADALGMAGGDGSQAPVAAVAAQHGVPFVCVPAGTRNHFALDLGVRRDDPVGALDAFVDGVERRVDLADVNGRAFVNNVSLGVYARAIHEPRYRDAKLRTLADTAAAVLGPNGDLPAMRFADDAGQEHTSAAVVLVSNNPYAIDRAVGRGTRPRLDTGALGVLVLDGPGGDDRAWSAATFEVAGRPPAPAGLDGEAVTLDTPLVFVARPGCLRVRIARRHPGVSPSALLPRGVLAVVPRLALIAAGRG